MLKTQLLMFAPAKTAVWSLLVRRLLLTVRTLPLLVVVLLEVGALPIFKVARVADADGT